MRIQKYAICIPLLLFWFRPIIAAEGKPTILESGRYVLQLTTDEKGDKPDSFPSTIAVQNGDISIDTKGQLGNPIKMVGRIKKDQIWIWMSDVEDSEIITFHLKGTVSSDSQASGVITIFSTHEKVCTGKWSLVRQR